MAPDRVHDQPRPLEGEVAGRFLAVVLDRPVVKRRLSDEHFSVDGTLVEPWASMKSFRPKGEADDEPPAGGRNGEPDFHGERRRNDSRASRTDLEARLFRKGAGKEARLSFMGHLLMENRSGLVVGAGLTQAIGFAECDAAVILIEGVRAGSGSRSAPTGPTTLWADTRPDEEKQESRDRRIRAYAEPSSTAAAKGRPSEPDK